MNQKQQLGERITGLKQEQAGNTLQAASQEPAKSVLIKKELEGLERLEAQQLVRTEKMTAMRREQARIEGEMAQLSSAAGQSKDKIAEIEMQRLSIDSEAKSEVDQGAARDPGQARRTVRAADGALRIS